MSGDHENDVGDVRYSRIHEGPIVDRNDPMGLGRVKVRVPGFLEPSSGWALPVGSPGGGGRGVGFKWVPPLGAEVAIYFKNGDPDAPRYLPGFWGAPSGKTIETPGEEKDPDVHVLETKQFLLRIDDRDGHEGWTLTFKRTGDFVEFDGTTATGPGFQVSAGAAIYLKCLGLIALEGLKVTVNDRPVSDGPQSI